MHKKRKYINISKEHIFGAVAWAQSGFCAQNIKRLDEVYSLSFSENTVQLYKYNYYLIDSRALYAE